MRRLFPGHYAPASCVIITIVLLAPATLAQAQAACPDLAPYYPGSDADWALAEERLAPLLTRCLDSSEYFALLGAAQLNGGRLGVALESLERALLLDPDNGAALVDYALALFEEGHLFTALEINERLLAREDLPPGLAPALQRRQRSWQARTRQREVRLDMLAGYDSNLNGAPADELLTLTLSGEPVPLTLNPEFQPVEGPYLSLRAGGRYRQLAPAHQHNLSLDLRGRVSEDTNSDILQASARYAFIRPDPAHAWQLQTGINHLFFGGSALFTGTDAGLRYQPAGDGTCRPQFTLALQHQYFHGQTQLNALEGKLAGGANCTLPAFAGSGAGQRIGLEMGLINNANIRDGRLGGDRDGWQFILDWQHPLFSGNLSAQLGHTRLKDSKGYSPLLAFNAIRSQNRTHLLLQYRRDIEVFRRPATFMVNFYHQRQDSNLELFRIRDTSAEVGFSFRF